MPIKLNFATLATSSISWPSFCRQRHFDWPINWAADNMLEQAVSELCFTRYYYFSPQCPQEDPLELGPMFAVWFLSTWLCLRHIGATQQQQQQHSHNLNKNAATVTVIMRLMGSLVIIHYQYKLFIEQEAHKVFVCRREQDQNEDELILIWAVFESFLLSRAISGSGWQKSLPKGAGRATWAKWISKLKSSGLWICS